MFAWLPEWPPAGSRCPRITVRLAAGPPPTVPIPPQTPPVPGPQDEPKWSFGEITNRSDQPHTIHYRSGTDQDAALEIGDKAMYFTRSVTGQNGTVKIEGFPAKRDWDFQDGAVLDITINSDTSFVLTDRKQNKQVAAGKLLTASEIGATHRPS